MKKIVIINGRGGVGKDSLIEKAAESGLEIMNISSIDPIKSLALEAGWNGIKDEKGRKFLSDLKFLCTGYNNLPQKYCCGKVGEFLRSDDDIMFIHIREPENIAATKTASIALAETYGVEAEVITMLVVREGAGAKGNISDDSVENYHYDVIFDNSCALDQSVKTFAAALKLSRSELLELLWNDFINAPLIHPEGCSGALVESWNGFHGGTAIEDIWQWFDESYEKGVVSLIKRFSQPEATVQQVSA